MFKAPVTMTVYIDSDVFCWINYCLNYTIDIDDYKIKEVSLKRTRKFPYEVQVPITIIGQFIKKDRTTIDLYALQQLNK